MSRHEALDFDEGVSCDACMKGNFRGRRFKCLVCYDYDLCSTCYEAGATTSRHTSDHPMQCILTRSDFEIYYAGESVSPDQPQSFTCPYCGRMGFIETTLQEHVAQEHADATAEVVCPICAALPGGEPNHVTDDFAAHLALEHRPTSSVIDEPTGIGMRHVRRLPPPTRGLGSNRNRRGNPPLHSSGGSLIGLVSNSRESSSMDPISELLSQLSSVRNRAAAAQSVSTQLQQLELQLQTTRFLEHQQHHRRGGWRRHQLERLPRQRWEAVRNSNPTVTTAAIDGGTGTGAPPPPPTNSTNENFLLSKITNQIHGEPASAEEKEERAMFVQDLLFSTILLQQTDISLLPVKLKPCKPSTSSVLEDKGEGEGVALQTKTSKDSPVQDPPEPDTSSSSNLPSSE